MGFGQCLHLMMAIGHSENPPSGFGEVITGFKGKRKGGGNFILVAFYPPSFAIPAALLWFIEHLCGAHYQRLWSFGLF